MRGLVNMLANGGKDFTESLSVRLEFGRIIT